MHFYCILLYFRYGKRTHYRNDKRISWIIAPDILHLENMDAFMERYAKKDEFAKYSNIILILSEFWS